MRILAVCSQGENRSRTLALLLKRKGVEANYAGLWNAERPVTNSLIDWADAIVVFEEEQRMELQNRFRGLGWRKAIINLEVPDFFSFNQPELVELLNRKIAEEKLA